MTLHTGNGCTIGNNGDFTGDLITPNCNIAAPGQATNAGCQILSPNTASFGTGFNAESGGVYATEWTSDVISIWFFPRSAIPADIASGSPDPTSWGTAAASFSGGCQIDSFFVNQQIVSVTLIHATIIDFSRYSIRPSAATGQATSGLRTLSAL